MQEDLACMYAWEGLSTLTDVRVHLLKSMASGPLKLKKGTRPVLILATWRHTTESVWYSKKSQTGIKLTQTKLIRYDK